MNFRMLIAVTAVCLIGAGKATAAPVSINWVTVGDPGNFSGDEIATGSGPVSYGAVGYEYQIGKYEVTNAQYVEFLNAKAASDPLALYNANMASNGSGGIIQNGVSGSFSYAVKPGHGNKPVNYVTFYDAARFTNWMNNGQGNADTESGAYTLVGGAATPTSPNSIVRTPGATIVLPTVDEWFKAAYYDPTKPNAVDEADYWRYPTQSDSVSLITALPSSTPHTANVRGTTFYGPDFGVGYAMTPGVGPPAIAAVDYLSDVGAYTGSASHYGTFDQAGNVIEWTQTWTMITNPNGVRIVLGGSFSNDEYSARYEGPAASTGTSGGIGSGFRLVNLSLEAEAVPEPSTGLLAATAFGVVVFGLARRRRQG